MTTEELIKKAKEALKMSYSPYSHFPVGAAILMKDGNVILGANIENASYPLGICAERCALFSAHMKGYMKEDMIAFALIGNTEEILTPCGACRQVLSELYPMDAPIYCANRDGKYRETTIKELLPFAFKEEDLHR